MTREELLSLYQVDAAGRVLSAGPFYGQPLYVPYFWFFYLTGYGELNDGVVSFAVRIEDRVQFPELKDRPHVYMLQQADGHIAEVDALY